MAGKIGAFLKGIRGQRSEEELSEEEVEEEEGGYSAQAWLEYLGLDCIADTPNESTCSMDELRAIMMIKRAEPLPEQLEELLLKTRDARIAKYGTRAKEVWADADDGGGSYEEEERITMTRARHHRR